MEYVALATTTIATGIWIGAIVFHSLVVAPTVFVNIDETAAKRFLRAIFPRFYQLGLICGTFMLVGLTITAFSLAWPGVFNTLLVIASIMILLEGLSLWLVPRINAARDAGTAGAARFKRLHRLSVMLTLLILILGIGVLATLGSAGIFLTAG